MDCKRIRELIITDYADGEASEALRKDIEEHLRICSRCKAFKAALDKAAIEPFKYARAEMPPERVWYNIKSSIEKGGALKPAINIFDYLGEFLRPRKAVFAFAAAAIIMLVASLSVIARYNIEKAASNYLQEQIESLYSINGNGYSNLTGADYTGFDTSIEQFFL